MGEDTPLGADGAQNLAFLDRDLEILLTGYAQAVSGADTTLNAIREEVHIALMADRTQGLAYVHDTIPGDAEEPDVSEDSETPTVRQVTRWIFRYRHSVTDPGA